MMIEARSRRCKNPACGGPTHYRQTRHGYCNACYLRWRRAGKPDSGPPAAPEARVINKGHACRAGHNTDAQRAGLCWSCYRRWVAEGRPDEVAPPALSPADLYAEFCFLRDGGTSREEAARRVGISRTSSYDYDIRRRTAA